MQKFSVLFLIFGACTSDLSVIRAIDGDTVELSDGQHMRLVGIDCPESHVNRKCLHSGVEKCAAEVGRGVAVAQDVRHLIHGARAQIIGHERYGRALGYVWLADGSDLGQWLVATGRCANWSAKYPHPRAALY